VLFSALGVVIRTMTVVGILTIALAGQTKIYQLGDLSLGVWTRSGLCEVV